jgi:hypothetical protein
MHNSCYQLCGPTVDEYGLQQRSEAWLEDNEESFDAIKIFWVKSEKEVVRECLVQECTTVLFGYWG